MTDSPLKSAYDVVIIGGGPAGATVGTLLQRAGHDCLILESHSFPRYHIGESLIPQTYPTLAQLGLLERLAKSNFPVKHSVRFVSESGKESDPFYFSETIPGAKARTWQVERSEFDRICLQNAIESGVRVLQPAQVQRVIFDGPRATGVVVKPAGQEAIELQARVVVDASGRGTLLGNQLGLKEDVPGLEKASIWSYYRGARRRSGIDAGETTVILIPQRGWFWYIPLPDDIVSVGVVASPDYLFDEGNAFEPVFDREVARCAGLGEFLQGAVRHAPVRGLRRLAYRNRQISGAGWVMVGDAAAFLDPIYSSGLFLALGSAEFAADCIDSGLRAGDLSGQQLGAFGPRLMNGIEIIRRLIFAFYDTEFSFRDFVARYPAQRSALIQCLVGDVMDQDLSAFVEALDLWKAERDVSPRLARQSI